MAAGYAFVSVPGPGSEVSEPITAADDQAETTTGVPVAIDVLANDSGNPQDPSDPNSPLSAGVFVLNGPRHGAVQVDKDPRQNKLPELACEVQRVGGMMTGCRMPSS
jgi:hypothetical protein